MRVFKKNLVPVLLLISLAFGYSSLFSRIIEAGIEEIVENVQLKQANLSLQLDQFIHQISHVSKALDILRLNPFTPNPDIYRTHVELIVGKGFNYEEHKIITEDGYILTAWRISKNVTKLIPVVLQHGLLDASFTWILNSEEESLPFLLADLGYDVWLTNNRGNKYSHEHIKYNSDKDLEYWQFSWDEMAKYDLPANINYVKLKSGASQVFYVGHSQGTTQMFAQLALNPDFKHNLKYFFGLGPVVNIKHQNSWLIDIIDKTRLVDVLDIFHAKNLLYIKQDVVPTLGLICSAISGICVDVVDLLCGFTTANNYNKTRMSVMASHEPGGASIKTLLHWMQLKRTNTFQMFDFGSEGNMAHYNSTTPPIYDLKNLQSFDVDSLFFLGSKDALATIEDFNENLAPNLNQAYYDLTVVDDYNHLDYAWAVDANTKVYAEIIQRIESSVVNSFNN